MTDFYAGYGAFKGYATPSLRPKHMRRFDREVWGPARCSPGMAMLEVGCGAGLFLAYLHAKGVTDLLGVDRDPALAAIVPAEVAESFRAADIRDFLAGGAEGRRFDRVFMFDVIEHFTAEEGMHLLGAVAAVLKAGARVVVKVPNMASPWGAAYQFGDLTHKAAYTPASLRQLGQAAGYVCTACLPVREGSPLRRASDRALHALVGRLVMTPPEIWTANVLAILERNGQ